MHRINLKALDRNLFNTPSACGGNSANSLSPEADLYSHIIFDKADYNQDNAKNATERRDYKCLSF